MVDDRQHVSLFVAYRSRIGVWISLCRCIQPGHAGVGSEGEKREVHHDMVARGREQEGLEIADESFVNLPCRRLDEPHEWSPDAGAHEGDAVTCHVGEITFPNPGITRTGEVPVLVLRSEVVGANREVGFSIAGQEVSLHVK